MATKLKEVDAVVVGLGWTGGILAKELTQAGLKVVALERGVHRNTAEDYALPGVRDELRFVHRHDLMQNPARDTITVRNNVKQEALPPGTGDNAAVILRDRPRVVPPVEPAVTLAPEVAFERDPVNFVVVEPNARLRHPLVRAAAAAAVTYDVSRRFSRSRLIAAGAGVGALILLIGSKAFASGTDETPPAKPRRVRSRAPKLSFTAQRPGRFDAFRMSIVASCSARSLSPSWSVTRLG